MRLLHISDLHLGKMLYGYSLLEDQKECLDHIVETIKAYHVDVLLIAGDIYDKTNPNNGAIRLWNDFLVALSMVQPSIEVIVIAGNHDPFVKLDYGASLFEIHHIHIWSSPLDDQDHLMPHLQLQDEYGPYHIYGTPFVRPSAFGGWKTNESYGYTNMMKDLLDHQDIDPNARNVWLSHQFFVNTSFSDVTTSESESSVLLSGGLDAIALKDMVLPFDYMAFGHLHTYQKLKDIPAYYSGSIYPYSLSESGSTKKMNLVEIKEKGNIMVQPLDIHYSRNIRLLKMDYPDILEGKDGDNHDDYVAIELPKPCGDIQYLNKLKTLYPHLLTVSVHSNDGSTISSIDKDYIVDLDPLSNIEKLYTTIYGNTMSTNERQWIESIILEDQL